MTLPIKIKLPDIYIEEMQEYQRISNKPTRTTSGQASFTNNRTLASYSTVGTIYDNQGEQGLGLLLYNISPKLKDYIFSDEEYSILRSSVSQSLTPIQPSSGTSTSIVISLPTDYSKFTLEIPSLITGGNITVNGLPLYVDYALTEQLTELEAGIYTIFDKTSAFYLAPKGADEWGGLQFVIDEIDGRLYFCNFSNSLSYEIDLDTGVSLNSAASPSTSPYGIGGIAKRLYTAITNGNVNHELDADTLLSLNSAASPATSQRGIGGIDNRLYLATASNTTTYEIDKDTLAQISSAAAADSNIRGIGGIASRLYSCGASTNLIYELDVDTKLAISNATSPSTFMQGIGGTKTRLYTTSDNTDLVYELDVDTKLQVGSFPSPSTSSFGVGGLSDSIGISITSVLFNGTEYELTDDSQFRVSGVSV